MAIFLNCPYLAIIFQAAAHIHRYLNLDEEVLKEIIGDSKEGKPPVYTIFFYCICQVNMSWQAFVDSVMAVLVQTS